MALEFPNTVRLSGAVLTLVEVDGSIKADVNGVLVSRLKLTSAGSEWVKNVAPKNLREGDMIDGKFVSEVADWGYSIQVYFDYDLDEVDELPDDDKSMNYTSGDRIPEVYFRNPR